MRYFELCRVRDVSPTSTDVEMSAPCVQCEVNCVYVVTDDDYMSMRWKNEIPQHLPIATREFMMSGLCRTCQEDIFSEEDDDE